MKMKLRVKELSEALNVDSSEILAICALLNIPATTRISSMTIQDAKKITDHYDKQDSHSHKDTS
tara:strand:- start:263 stop:454 length:192 start_codon:yes stop_codon:yes gene_type:complete